MCAVFPAVCLENNQIEVESEVLYFEQKVDAATASRQGSPQPLEMTLTQGVYSFHPD